MAGTGPDIGAHSEAAGSGGGWGVWFQRVLMLKLNTTTREEWMTSIQAAWPRIERFMRKRRTVTETSCYGWSGAANKKGYPVVSIKTPHGWTVVNLSRVLLAVAGRLDISDQSVLACHTCDSPPCTNENHLFPGSHADNSQDAFDKGRHAPPRRPGTSHPFSKLSEDQVREIRSSPNGCRVLAREYGLSRHSITFIRRRLTYKEVA